VEFSPPDDLSWLSTTEKQSVRTIYDFFQRPLRAPVSTINIHGALPRQQAAAAVIAVQFQVRPEAEQRYPYLIKRLTDWLPAQRP
jgi:hypothetical protein